MPTLHIFIVSWAGQHANAARIAESLSGAADRLSIVYSDPDLALIPDAGCESIRRPNELYWGDKFKACLDACDEDLMLVIHADCQCDDWKGMAGKCREAHRKINNLGVWAPLVDWTPFDIANTVIATIDRSPLRVVAQTDAIVFSLSRPVADRMRRADYEKNIYGWGIPWMFVACAFSNNMLAVVDESVPVKHPQGRGYDENAARSQMNEFLQQLSPAELVQYRLLKSHIELNRRINMRRQKPGR